MGVLRWIYSAILCLIPGVAISAIVPNKIAAVLVCIVVSGLFINSKWFIQALIMIGAVVITVLGKQDWFSIVVYVSAVIFVIDVTVQLIRVNSRSSRF